MKILSSVELSKFRGWLFDFTFACMYLLVNKSQSQLILVFDTSKIQKKKKCTDFFPAVEICLNLLEVKSALMTTSYQWFLSSLQKWTSIENSSEVFDGTSAGKCPPERGGGPYDVSTAATKRLLPDTANSATVERNHGRVEEKIYGKNHFLFSTLYITLDALSFTGKDFQRSIFINIRPK